MRSAMLVLTLLLSATPVAAGPLEDATFAYNNQDYATALRLLRPLADKGEPAAQFQLAVMYGSGQGVPKDYAQALKWHRMAAERGFTNAQYQLGMMYGLGQGTAKDYVQAYLWLTLAVAGGMKAAADDRDQFASRLTNEQAAEVRQQARDWTPK